MHQLKRIQFFQPLNSDSKVIVYENVTGVDVRFAPKVEYQRSVVQQIISTFLDQEITIEHKESGAPFIVEFPEKNISISHSQDYYAIQLSDRCEVGIDIQVFKKNLEKGRNYFINEWEEDNLEMTALNLHLIWSAKETVYKLLKGKVVKYKEDITIESIHKNIIKIKINGVFLSVGYKINDSFVLVYQSNYEKY